MMKLKILPPTLREKKRYIAFFMYSQKSIGKDEFIVFLWNNVINLYGEIKSSKINPWLTSFKSTGCEDDKYTYKGIIKCRSGYEEELLVCLNSIFKHKDSRVVIHTKAVSGTIKTLDEKYNLL